MPLEIPPGYAHVALEFRHDLDPDPWYVTHGVDSSGVAGDPEALAELAMDAFWTAWSGSFSNAVALTGCQVTVGQDGADPVRLFGASAISRRGTRPGDYLPQNCALLVRKYSALGGRRNRGRCFLPGVLDETTVSATGLIVPATIEVATLAANTWLAFLDTTQEGSTGPTPMVILHSTGISLMGDPAVVTSLNVDNVISTQRRRLR